MSLLFLLIAAMSIIIFVINNLVRTLRRSKQVGFWEMTLAFLIVALILAALITDNANAPIFDAIEGLSIIVVSVLAVTSVPLTIAELFRPQRMRQSRGILGIGMSVLLYLAVFSNSFVALFVAATERPAPIPTPINQTAAQAVDVCDFQGRFQNIGIIFIEIIVTETGLTTQEIMDKLADSEDRTVQQFIEANGGNVDNVKARIIALIDQILDEAVDNRCFTEVFAIGLSGQLENVFIPQMLNQKIGPEQFNELFTGADGQTLSASDIEATLTATILVPTHTPTATPSATPTATITPSPTASRTPRPTESPTSTRERYLSPTPTLTPTLPNPCLAVMNFNVNLRDYPDSQDSQVIATIPFETTVTLFGRTEDSLWWFAQYAGEAGWVSNEFISVTSACRDLPVRDPGRR